MLLLTATRRGGQVVPPDPEPSISVVVAPSGRVIEQGDTGDYTVTVTRQDFTGTVTGDVTGLPTGVTGSWPDGDTWTGGTTARTLRLSAAGDAPVVSDDPFTVTCTGTGVSDSDGATVTVTEGSGLLWEPNKPSGLTTLGDVNFASTSGNNAGPFSIYWDARFLTNESSAPDNPPYAYECYYPGNHINVGDGGGMIQMTNESLGLKEWYSCSRWKFSADYVTHQGWEKFWYPVLRNGRSQVIALSPPEITNGEIASYMRIGDYFPLPGNDDTQVIGTETVPKGEWVLMEAHARMNTGSNYNGMLRVWVNGVLSIELTNLRWSTSGSTDYFDWWRMTGTRGGGTANRPTPAGGQYRRCSRLSLHGVTS